MYTQNWSEDVQCPYNKSHIVSRRRLVAHLSKCEKQYPNIKLVKCVYNICHLVEPEQLLNHYETCEDKRLVDEGQYRNSYMTASQLSLKASLCSENGETLSAHSVSHVGSTSRVVRKDSSPPIHFWDVDEDWGGVEGEVEDMPSVLSLTARAAKIEREADEDVGKTEVEWSGLVEKFNKIVGVSRNKHSVTTNTQQHARPDMTHKYYEPMEPLRLPHSKSQETANTQQHARPDMTHKYYEPMEPLRLPHSKSQETANTATCKTQYGS